MLGVGALLRRALGWGQAQADVLNTLIVDVTMPALIIGVLAKSAFQPAALWVLLPALAAMIGSSVLAALVVRALGGGSAVQAAASLSGAYANTGFLGFPLLLTLFPGDALAASTGLVVDVGCTTVAMWTVGFALASRLARRGSTEAVGSPASLRAFLLRPLVLSIAIGAACNLLGVALPTVVERPLSLLGAATQPLVFLSLGLTLDVAALRGRALPIASTALVKLCVAPLLCLLLAHGLAALLAAGGIAPPPPRVVLVGVLDCAMPSAMVSVVVTARVGGDRAFAAGVAALTTLACIATLPLAAAVAGW